MRLVMYGVPWAEAWKMSDARRIGLIVAAGEILGGEFDWSAMGWREKKPPGP